MTARLTNIVVALVLIVTGDSLADGPVGHEIFGHATTGQLACYHLAPSVNGAHQDLSGAAVNGGIIAFRSIR